MRWIITYRKLFLTLLVLGTATFAFFLKDLYINFSFESFYPKDDPAYITYDHFQKQFGETENVMYSVALKSPTGSVFDKQFLSKADAIFQSFRPIPHVDSLISGTRFAEVRRTGMGFKQVPYFDFSSDSAVQKSKEKILADSALFGSFITKDGDWLCAHFTIERAIYDGLERDKVSQKVDEILQTSGMEYIVSGVPYIRSKYVDKIGSELFIFVSIAVVLLVIILAYTFRNAWNVVIPLLTVAVGVIWTFGMMAVTGQAINLITNLLVPIVFVVGVSDIIHITTKYLAELKAGHEPKEAMLITLDEIGFATFLTCITTAVGFASLAITDVSPLRVFGIYGCFGVVATYLISITIIPNILMMIPKEKLIHARSVESSPAWERVLEKIFQSSMQRPLRISGIILVGFLISLYFTFRIPTNMHLLEDISWRDPVRSSMVFFEEKLFGLRPFEMIIRAKKGHTLSERGALVEIEKIQNQLGKSPNFRQFLSPVSFLQGMNYVAHFSHKEYKKLPETQAEIDELMDLARSRAESSQLLKWVITPDNKEARLGSRSRDLGANAHKKIREDLDAYIRSNCDLQYFDYEYTGHGYLTENNMTYLRESLLTGLVVDFLTIGLIMGLMYGSFRMLIISMIPNVLPLIATAGIMGLFGITLTTTSAVVFVVIFGIAVDDTIHFMTHYKLELAKGIPIEEALRRTMIGTGKAMALTSIVLLTGFGTLLSSTFGGTFNIGLFSLITIIFAVFSDLYLAPILLKYFGPKR